MSDAGILFVMFIAFCAGWFIGGAVAWEAACSVYEPSARPPKSAKQ